MDPITVVVKITATPDAESGAFTATDVREALAARLSEFYPVDGWPIVPKVEFFPSNDGADPDVVLAAISELMYAHLDGRAYAVAVWAKP